MGGVCYLLANENLDYRSNQVLCGETKKKEREEEIVTTTLELGNGSLSQRDISRCYIIAPKNPLSLSAGRIARAHM